jgi:hypothetical protein
MMHHRPFQKVIRLGGMFIFLLGFAAYGSALASKFDARSSTPVRRTATWPGPTVTRSTTSLARTRIPPGHAKKTGTPHIPPGLAKKTKTPTATPTPARPVTGSVLIEDGRCCAGGCIGQVIDIDVEFSASSPFGKVDEMRVARSSFCWDEPAMRDAAWESFTPLKTYPFRIAPNWVPFYVSAQFRDEHGNLSPVYCDDFHVEGWCVITRTP